MDRPSPPEGKEREIPRVVTPLHGEHPHGIHHLGIDDQVNAFCSSDGKNWFTVGTIAFQSDGPGRVGLYAIGEIYRPIYPESFPEGSAIHFQSTYLWGEIEPELNTTLGKNMLP